MVIKPKQTTICRDAHKRLGSSVYVRMSDESAEADKRRQLVEMRNYSNEVTFISGGTSDLHKFNGVRDNTHSVQSMNM